VRARAGSPASSKTVEEAGSDSTDAREELGPWGTDCCASAESADQRAEVLAWVSAAAYLAAGDMLLSPLPLSSRGDLPPSSSISGSRGGSLPPPRANTCVSERRFGGDCIARS
jgi:hypothetical protein